MQSSLIKIVISSLLIFISLEWLRGGKNKLTNQIDIPVKIPESSWVRGLSPKESNLMNNNPLLNTDELSQKIIRSTEYYFYDANLFKDQFLLNSLKSAKDGWVKIDVISGFKKIQYLTKDKQFLLSALRRSSRLEVSEDGIFIRKRDAQSPWENSVYHRMILISSLPKDEVISFDSVKTIFQASKLCVILVRILNPGQQIPKDLVKSQSVYKQLSEERCIVVEFKTKEYASQATEYIKKIWPECFSCILAFNYRNDHSLCWDRSVFDRTILISSIPKNEVISISSVQIMFAESKLSTALVRILDPSRKIPKDLIASQSVYKQLGEERCIVVDFQTKEDATLAAAYVKKIWPNCSSCVLEFTITSNKKLNYISEIEGLTQPPERPHIILTNSHNTGPYITLIRDVVAPPSEDSIGFEPGWSDFLLLQSVLPKKCHIYSESTPEEASGEKSSVFSTPDI